MMVLLALTWWVYMLLLLALRKLLPQELRKILQRRRRWLNKVNIKDSQIRVKLSLPINISKRTCQHSNIRNNNRDILPTTKWRSNPNSISKACHNKGKCKEPSLSTLAGICNPKIRCLRIKQPCNNKCSDKCQEVRPRSAK